MLPTCMSTLILDFPPFLSFSIKNTQRTGSSYCSHCIYFIPLVLNLFRGHLPTQEGYPTQRERKRRCSDQKVHPLLIALEIQVLLCCELVLSSCPWLSLFSRKHAFDYFQNKHCWFFVPDEIAAVFSLLTSSRLFVAVFKTQNLKHILRSIKQIKHIFVFRRRLNTCICVQKEMQIDARYVSSKEKTAWVLPHQTHHNVRRMTRRKTGDSEVAENRNPLFDFSKRYY